MKTLTFLSLLFMMTMPSTSTFHSFTIQGLNKGQSIQMKDYAGKKILVVNVASKCGYTSQYTDLQKLSELYKDELVVIGFPCNQFMGQEPGTEQEIAGFCQANYGVTFPITQKVEVKGKDQHPIFKWLTTKDQNGLDDFKVSWNFNKFLINEKGELLRHFDSGVKPLSTEITDYLK